MANRIEGIILWKPVVAGFFLLLIFAGGNLLAQTGWYFTSSVQVSGGNYIFESYSRALYIYGGFRYQGEKFGITSTIPLVSNNDSQSQINGMMTSPDNISPMQSGMNLGIGDIYNYFDYKIFSDYETGIDLFVNAQIKIPTASVGMSIGTGEFDYGGSITFRKTIEDWVGIIDLGYLNIGDPGSVTYINPFTYGIGLGKFFNYGEYSLLLYYIGYTKVLEGFDAPRQVSLGANNRISDTVILSLIGSLGVGNTAPEFTLSGGIRVKL